jgi:hypothetical protein
MRMPQEKGDMSSRKGWIKLGTFLEGDSKTEMTAAESSGFSHQAASLHKLESANDCISSTNGKKPLCSPKYELQREWADVDVRHGSSNNGSAKAS